MLTALRVIFFHCLFVLALLQVGCGQKGDLYLPAIPAAPNVLSDGQAARSDSLETATPERLSSDESVSQDEKSKGAEQADAEKHD